MGQYGKSRDDRRYDTETVGLLLAIGLLLIGAAGLIIARVWL